MKIYRLLSGWLTGRIEKMKLFILLPSYNEGEALPYLLNSLSDLLYENCYNYEVLVINDGSLDDTERIALAWGNKLNLKVLNHNTNLGLGEAVNTGLSYFYENCADDDAVVIMDADNTHDVKNIPYMLDNIRKGSDVVIASRYESGGREIGLSFFRRFCSYCANMLLKQCFNISGVKDYTCGYRIYNVNAIKTAYKLYGPDFILEKGFTCMAEIIIKLSMIGCSISEVPLVLRYDLKKGHSKMKLIRTILRYFVLIRNIKNYKRNILKKPVLAQEREK